MSLAGTQNPRAEALQVPAAELPRQTWTVEAVLALFELPFNDLLYRAHTVHRQHFDANTVQLSTLLSIKTGGCPEDCAYCPQSARYRTGVEAQRAAAARSGAHGGAPCEGGGCDALLHGRGLARTEGSRARAGAGDGEGREGARAGNLRHARHAARRPGREAQAIRPRLLQPQSGHRARVLRRHHHHPRLRRSPRHAGAQSARPASTSAAAASSAWGNRALSAQAWLRNSPISTLTPSPCPSTTWFRSRARPCTVWIRWILSSSCAPSRPRVSLCRAPTCGCPRGARRCRRPSRRCASSPAPTRSSTATSC